MFLAIVRTIPLSTLSGIVLKFKIFKALSTLICFVLFENCAIANYTPQADIFAGTLKAPSKPRATTKKT